MTRGRRLLAAAALAVTAVLAAAGCRDITEAPVPARSACPSGQHWQQAAAGGKYGCHAGNGTGEGAP